MKTLRNSRGQFIKGSKFWLGKKRPDMRGNKWNVGRMPWNYNRITKTCSFCSKKYLVTKSRAERSKFCSRSCMNKFLFTGKKNVNWKGGIVKNRNKLKESKEYSDWRLKVYRRDRFTCRLCGYKSKGKKDIHAHHVDSIRETPRLCLKEGNGITLCLKCHRKTYGKEKEFATVFKEILRDYTLDKEKS